MLDGTDYIGFSGVGCVEHKDDADSVMQCMMETEGRRVRGHPKSWWDSVREI